MSRPRKPFSQTIPLKPEKTQLPILPQIPTRLRSPQPTPDSEPQPEPTLEPSDGLPSNWQSLTSQQKKELNPFDCDHDTQWVSAEDGSCIDRPAVIDPVNPTDQPTKITYFDSGKIKSEAWHLNGQRHRENDLSQLI